MKKRIGLVTCARLPELNEADQVLLPTFEKLGWEAQPVIWDDPKVNKGKWWMPWLSEAKKDVTSCDKLRVAANKH